MSLSPIYGEVRAIIEGLRLVVQLEVISITIFPMIKLLVKMIYHSLDFIGG